MEKRLSILQRNIESLIQGAGGINDYHAQVLSGAIIQMLRDEGIIESSENEIDESEDDTAKE